MVTYVIILHLTMQWKWQNGSKTLDSKRHPILFRCIFFNENVCILINISLKFVPKCQILTTPALVQIMAWHWPGDKPLSEPVMVNVLMHICITRPLWVKKWNDIAYPNVWAIYFLPWIFQRKINILQKGGTIIMSVHSKKRHTKSQIG